MAARCLDCGKEIFSLFGQSGRCLSCQAIHEEDDLRVANLHARNLREQTKTQAEIEFALLKGKIALGNHAEICKTVQDIAYTAVDDAENRDLGSLPLANLLQQSLYYPACGLDGDPIKFLCSELRLIYSFVYVDCEIAADEVLREINHPGFRGYHIFGHRELNWHEITQGYGENAQRFSGFKVMQPIATWYVLEHNSQQSDTQEPERFSLLFVQADGV